MGQPVSNHFKCCITQSSGTHYHWEKVFLRIFDTKTTTKNLSTQNSNTLSEIRLVRIACNMQYLVLKPWGILNCLDSMVLLWKVSTSLDNNPSIHPKNLNMSLCLLRNYRNGTMRKYINAQKNIDTSVYIVLTFETAV